MTNLETLLQKINRLAPESLKKLHAFTDYLIWEETQQANDRAKVGWSFDFIEHFNNAAKSPQESNSGAEIKIGLAQCEGLEKPAIYAHPPVSGQSIIEYYVPIPQDITNLTLNLAIGIRDGAKLYRDNLVAFSIRLNGYRLWGTQTNHQKWQLYTIDLALPQGDISKIEFVTEALGEHQWTWAVWGEPTITGIKTK